MVNDISFWKVWSPSMAYALGFAFADGSVDPTKDTLILYQKDKRILIRLLEESPARSLILSRDSKVWRLRYTSSGLASILADYGVVPNKTHNGFWPPSIPREMVPHYIRGFFDGDGSVSYQFYSDGMKASLGFVCHLDRYLRDLQSVIALWGAGDGSLFNDGGNWRLRYSSLQDINTITKRMYMSCGKLFVIHKRTTCNHIQKRLAQSVWHQERQDGKRKLTTEQAAEIRNRRANGESLKSIARDYPVNFQMVSRICRGESYV